MEESYKLTVENVHDAINKSIYSDEEVSHLGPEGIPPGAIVGEGILVKYGFKPENLETQRVRVKTMLLQLPDKFMVGSGDGFSFLGGCETRIGELWGQHHDVEMLLCLGMALGMVRCLVPRDMWKVLPGGLPYYVIDVDGFKDNKDKPHG